MAPRKKQQPVRRKPGSGAIRHKRGRALPYEAAFPIGGEQHRYDYFATRPEAEAHLDRLVAERDDTKQPRNIAKGSQRIDQFLQSWLNTKRARVKAKTLHSYQYYCELAIGEIGSQRLDSLDREGADDLLYGFYIKGFKNVKEMRMVLNQAFTYAEDEGYIARNPFKKVRAPSVEHRAAQALTRAQRTHLLLAAAEEDDPAVPLCPLWHLYCRLGLRKGEGIALLWGRGGVDLDAGLLTVSQQFTNVGKETVKSTPKTKKSQRTIPIPADLIEILRRHKAAQITRAAADAEWEHHNLVFPDAHGRPLTFWYVPYRWAKLRKRAGLPASIRLHDLRHTALYLLEQDGIPQSVRMTLAGHSATAMAAHYADHAADDMTALRAAVERTA